MTSPDNWSELDDTLADGPAPAELPAAARPWLAGQRCMHGLLRSLHTADAAAREARLARLLERIDTERAAAPRRHWQLVAAAAFLLASIILFGLLPTRLPSADAAVLRALGALSLEVDRRFRVEMVALDPAGREQLRQEFALVTRPGSRFRVDGKLSFGGLQLGELRIGCDGEELWLLSANGLFRRAVPVTDRERLLQGVGEVLDLGYLDVHQLVAHLPERHNLRVTGRQRDEDGRRLLRIEGKLPTESDGEPSLLLLCEEASGMVTRLQLDAEAGPGFRRQLRFSYLGEESPGLVDYRRPW